MTAAYHSLDLVQLSAQAECAALDDRLTLIDSTVDGAACADMGVQFVDFPVKLSFNLALFCVAGSITFRINLHDYELHAGQVLVATEGALGEYVSHSPDLRLALIAVRSDFVPLTLRPDMAISMRNFVFRSPVFSPPPGALAECLTIFRLMRDKLQEHDNPYRADAVQGYLQVLVANAYHYRMADAPAVGGDGAAGDRARQLYTQFLAEVERSHARERSVTYYASRLCLSPKHLSRVVREAGGRPAADWIADYVTLEAKALLKSRQYTVQQVSDRLNFANPSFFAKYFKAHTGSTPTEYLKS